MKNKYDYKFNKTIKILLWALVGVLIAYLVAVVSSFIGETNFEWTDLVFPVVFTAIFVIILVSFKKSHYLISKEGITIQLSIGKTVILADHITTIRFVKPTNQLVVCHFVKADDPRLSLIQIDEADYEQFSKAVTKTLPHVLYQEFIDDD